VLDWYKIIWIVWSRFYYLQWVGYCLWRVPKKWTVWLKSSSTTNGSSTESGIPCNHGQLVFKPRCVPQVVQQTDWRYGNLASKQEIKSAKLKKGVHGSVYRETNDNEVEKQKNMFVLLSITHDDKMVPSRVWGQDMESPRVVVVYNSGMEGADLSDAY
jgi:hypothetical protein